jgi:hypothetical protein
MAFVRGMQHEIVSIRVIWRHIMNKRMMLILALYLVVLATNLVFFPKYDSNFSIAVNLLIVPIVLGMMGGVLSPHNAAFLRGIRFPFILIIGYVVTVFLYLTYILEFDDRISIDMGWASALFKIFVFFVFYSIAFVPVKYKK